MPKNATIVLLGEKVEVLGLQLLKQPDGTWKLAATGATVTDKGLSVSLEPGTAILGAPEGLMEAARLALLRANGMED